MSVKARMKVMALNAVNDAYVNVTLSAVYSSDPSDPNYSYSQATPSGTLSLNITNPDAFSQFSEGDTFDIDFTKVDVVATEPELPGNVPTDSNSSTPVVSEGNGNPPAQSV